MPAIDEFRCDRCGFALPTGWGDYFYAINDAGERIHCPHPGEGAFALMVIEKSIPDFHLRLRETKSRFYKLRFRLRKLAARWGGGDMPINPWSIYDERTGYNQPAVCRHCVAQFDFDAERDPRACPKCGDHDVATLRELVNQSCPECVIGVIRCIPTGAVT